MSKAIGIMYKSSFFLNNSSLRTLYYSLIPIAWASGHSATHQIPEDWETGCKNNAEECVRCPHSDPLFQNSGILNLESIYKLQIGKFMYLYKSGLLPHSFNTVKPLLGGSLLSGLLSIPKFASHIYWKFDLYSTVTSIKRTRSPFGFSKWLI